MLGVVHCVYKVVAERPLTNAAPSGLVVNAKKLTIKHLSFIIKKGYLCGVIMLDLKIKTMTVVSSKEFATYQDKYFDMALNDHLIIQRGDNMFLVQNFVQNVNKPKSRQGWAEAAKEFVGSGNEEMFFSDFFKDEDLSWWQWEQQ